MRKPSPLELAAFITEDEYGLPMVTAQPGAGEQVSNVGPQFDQDGRQPTDDQVTQMQQCAASGCMHNEAGRCGLGSIDINEHGGCAQYEASADGAQDDTGRYDEADTDVTGGVAQTHRQSAPLINRP